MEKLQQKYLEIKHLLLVLWWLMRELGYFIKSFLRSRIRLMWAKAYVRKDEFHSSLDIDSEYLETATEKQREKYIKDLIKRRNKSHEADMRASE